jgi:muramoyltetrapeptide carboxypeptidase
MHPDVALDIELIAPSGYPQDMLAVERGIGRLREAGCTVRGIEAAQRRFQRFAGPDEARAADLNRLADPAHPLPDIALCVRGGYGASRILDRLDYAGLQRRLTGASTMLIGHSDFTAIQMALLAKAGLVTFGGPMLAGNFGAAGETFSEFTFEHFWKAVRGETLSIAASTPQEHVLDIDGVLWGGNLALLAALAGTPYMPSIDGGILFVEDIAERPFRVERMLYQLHYAGILERQQAIVFGDFSQGEPVAYDNGFSMNDVAAQIRAVTGIPVLSGLPFGHCGDTLTLPVGARAHLHSGAHGFRLTIADYPHAGGAGMTARMGSNG